MSLSNTSLALQRIRLDGASPSYGPASGNTSIAIQVRLHSRSLTACRTCSQQPADVFRTGTGLVSAQNSRDVLCRVRASKRACGVYMSMGQRCSPGGLASTPPSRTQVLQVSDGSLYTHTGVQFAAKSHYYCHTLLSLAGS